MDSCQMLVKHDSLQLLPNLEGQSVLPYSLLTAHTLHSLTGLTGKPTTTPQNADISRPCLDETTCWVGLISTQRACQPCPYAQIYTSCQTFYVVMMTKPLRCHLNSVPIAADLKQPLAWEQQYSITQSYLNLFTNPLWLYIYLST